jgi:hypothetical protein
MNTPCAAAIIAALVGLIYITIQAHINPEE